MGLLGNASPLAVNAQSKQAALKSLEIDKTLPQSHSIMGMLKAVEFDWRGAEQEFRTALEIDPESADVWRDYQYFYLISTGRLDEAITALQRLVKQDPLSPMLRYLLGYGYVLTRQGDRAIEQYRGALELDPYYFLAHLALGTAYVNMGKFDEGIQATETGTQILKRNSFSLGYLGLAYAKAGRIGEARMLLDELIELARMQYVPPSGIVRIYIGLGEINNAFDWLEKAADVHDSAMLHVHIIPAYSPLRSHLRYQTLLRKMNLEP